MPAQTLDVEDLEARALHLDHRLGQSGQVAIGKDVTGEELRLTGRPPVETVRDAVVEIETAVLEHGVDAGEERRVVRDADVLDHPDRGDLVVAGVGRQVAHVEVLDPTALAESERRDALGGVVGLGARQGDAVGADAVVLGGPDGEAAPAAADVEQALVAAQAQLAADQIELVGLGLLERAVGLAIVGARVDHERIEEQRVEVVGDVVVVGDRPGVPRLGLRAHDATSFMPKMRSNTTRRRIAGLPRTNRTAAFATGSGTEGSRRPSQPGSPAP